MATQTAPENATIGVIGLGAMGAPMASRLAEAGCAVIVSSSRPHPELVALGATQVDTAREVGARCDAVLLMLPDLPQVEQVLAGADGLLAETSDLLIMIGSTSSPTGVRELDERVRAQSQGRVRVIDCPVSGGEDGATAGTLAIMIGGDDGDARLATSLLAPCGTPVHLGPLGAGEVAKACNQMVVAATMMAIGDATVLAERSGLDLEKFWTLLGGGYAGSTVLRSRHRKIVDADYSPSGVAKYMVKDLGFATDVAEATGTNAAILPHLRAAFTELVQAGLGEDDIAVTRKFVAER